MILADITSTVLYSFAYAVQILGAGLVAWGLYVVARSNEEDLHELWTEQPDAVLSSLAKAGRRFILRVQRVGLWVSTRLRLHGTGTVVVALTANVIASVHMTAAGVVTAGDPPKHDPSKDIGPQFDALAEYARASLQIALDNRQIIQETIEAEIKTREAAIAELARKARQLTLGGFGAAVLGTGLLIVGVVLELAANFS